jgi:hypothetical protein
LQAEKSTFGKRKLVQNGKRNLHSLRAIFERSYG